MSTYSNPRRVRLSSREVIRYFLDAPRPYGPGHISYPALEEITSSLRMPWKSSRRILPRFSSALPYGGPYILAESKCVTPRSNARRTIARQVSKTFMPPKFCHVPNEIGGSDNPLRPQRRNSLPLYRLSSATYIICYASSLYVMRSTIGACPPGTTILRSF